MNGNRSFQMQPRLTQGEDCLLTKEELASKMNLPSTRMLDGLVARRKIPVIRLGYRTVRFRWGDVQTAMDRLTVWDHAAVQNSSARNVSSAPRGSQPRPRQEKSTGGNR
jgi:hypothetical protein